MDKKSRDLIAVYPGSFDPPTRGHIDIINRASKIFPRVVVAVTCNYNKNHMFSLEERVSMMKEALFKVNNVKVDFFSGLLVSSFFNFIFSLAHSAIKSRKFISFISIFVVYSGNDDDISLISPIASSCK